MPYITPPNTPTDKFCRRVLIPNSPQWVGTFDGALIPLGNARLWEQIDEASLTPDEAAQIWNDMLNEMFADVNCSGEMVETPFYDDEENVDDEEELGEQTWYDEISDWIISGFLAISFTPAAAIAYRATIPRIRLALKTHDLGTIARVIFGSVDVLYDTFSPTPEIVYLELDYGSTGLTEYPLTIENTGDFSGEIGEGELVAPNLQVVKGDLRPVLVDVRTNPENDLELQKTFDGTNWDVFAEITPQTLVQQEEGEPCNIVQSLDGGTDYTLVAQLNLCMPTIQVLIGEGGGIIIQTSPDGGTTWVDQGVIYTDPVGDTPPPQTPQPSDARCNASRNAMLAYYSMAWSSSNLLEQDPPLEPYLAAIEIIPMLRDRLNYFIGSNVFNSIVGNVNFALAVTAGLTPFYTAAIVGGGTTGAKIRELTDYDNGLVQAAIQCAIFCVTDSDGNVDFSDALDGLNALVGVDIQQGAVDFISMLGAGGMSAAASARITSVDASACEDCDCPDEWCHEFNFLSSNGDFEAGAGVGGWSGNNANYVLGTGWTANVNRTRSSFPDSYSSCTFQRLMPAAEYSQMTIEGTVSFGQQDAYTMSVALHYGESTLATQTASGAITIDWYGDVEGSTILLVEGNVGYNNTGGLAGGAMTVTKITVCGTGENPF